MPTYPQSKIIQISTTLARVDGTSILVTMALCADGTVWQLSRDLSNGAFLGQGWEAYPTGGAQ